MNDRTKRLLFWAPRILSILFAVFLALFALDVFDEGFGFWGAILALLIHLVPSILVLAVLAIAWHREWVGGIVFIGLSVWYVVSLWGKFPLLTDLLIAGPPVLVGTLFLLNWRYRAELQETQE
jgi:hypothetical protein